MSKAVMTIHGFLTDTQDFDRLYDYLDIYDEVKACEIPGHNGEVDFAKFTVESVVETVLSCYDELRSRHDEVDVIGFSMGGALCSYLCCRRDVHRAVMIAPSNKYFNLVSPFATMNFFLQSWHKTYSQTEGKIKSRIVAARASISPYKQNITTSMQIAFKRILPNISVKTFNVFSKLMKMVNEVIKEKTPVAVPSFIMWGKLDELVPRASITYLCKNFSNVKTKIYENVGHAMLLTNCDDVLIPDIIDYLSDGKVHVSVPFRGKK